MGGTVSRVACVAVCVIGCGRYGFDEIGDSDGTLGTDPIDIQGLVALYHFDEPAWSGATGEVVDSAGGEHGTADNGATTVAGQLGPAAAFDGTMSQSVTLDGAATSWQLTPPFTMVMWISPRSLPATASYRLASKSDATNNQREWEWSLDLATSTVQFDKSDDGSLSTGATLGLPVTAADIGRWMHCAIVVETDGTYREFRDGAETNSGAFANPTFFHGTAIPRIGRRMPGGRDSDALVDEFAIWARALSTAEIANLYVRQASGDPTGAIPNPSP